MAHCPFEKLNDLEDVLNEIRSFPSIKEAKPGIFYLKSKAFLHFHTDGTRRWADVRDGADWGTEIDIPFMASQKLKTAFVKEAKARYFWTVSGSPR